MSLEFASLLLAWLVVLPGLLRVFVIGYAGPLLGQAQVHRLQATFRRRDCLAIACATVLLGGPVIGQLAAGVVLIAAGEKTFGAGVVASACLSFGPLAVVCFFDVVSAHRDAGRSWAFESQLCDADVIVGSREVAIRRRWRWYAVTVGLDAAIAGGVYLVHVGVASSGVQVAAAIVAAGMAMTLLILRVIDVAYPVGEYLERLGLAIRAGKAMQPDTGIARSLIDHQDRRRGAGAGQLDRALPALHRAVQALLRRHPAWAEDSVHDAVAPLLAELHELAASGQSILPGQATQCSLRLAVRGEMPDGNACAVRIRPMADYRGWNRTPALLPGHIDRWLPANLVQLAKFAVGAGALGVAVVEILKGLGKL